MRIGIVGFGSVGQRHAVNIKTHFQLIGCDILVRDMVKNYPFRHGKTLPHSCFGGTETDILHSCGIVYDDESDFIDLIKNNDISGLIVATPTSDHPKWIKICLENNMRCYIEKPLARRWEDIDKETIDLIYEKKHLLHVGFQSFHDPMLYRFKDLIKDDWSRVAVKWKEDITKVHPWEDWKKGYAVRKELGGGVVSCYSHELAHITYIFGYPHKIDIVDVIYDKETNVEMEVQMILGYTHRSIYVTLSFYADQTERYIQSDSGNDLTVWDQNNRTIEYTEKTIPYKLESSQPYYKNDVFLHSLRHFIHSIGKETTPCPYPGIAINTLRLQTDILKLIEG